jgi:hypothetical protein
MSTEPTRRRKPKNWCGTEPSNDPNEADQTPVAETMASVPEGKRRYPCITQDGLNPTFGLPPLDPNADRHSHGPEIVLGVKNLIPRWTANKTTPTKLLYFVVREGFAIDADKK